MRKLICSLLLLASILSWAQDYSELWSAHYSYLNIKDVVASDNKIYIASENAIFTYDTINQNIDTISTISGLSGEFISTIHFSSDFNLLIIGYENGLIEIFNENNRDVLTIVDILDKVTIPPTNKRINHFNEYNNSLYIATDFGISVYNLERLEFGDTYFIGDNGTQIMVTQTAIINNFIYASCQNNSGIRKADVNSENLIDYQEWSQITIGNYIAVEALNETLFAVRNNRIIYQINIDDTLTLLFQYSSLPLDIKSYHTNLIVTTKDEVFVYDDMFNLLANPLVTPEVSTQFTSAIAVSQNVYIGTKDFGMLVASFSDPTSFIEIHPDGPLRNSIFSLEAQNSNLWVTFGDYNFDYNPSPVRRFGFSRFLDNAWTNVNYEEVFNLRNLNAISVNPFSLDQVFISSFQDGILELADGVPLQRFDHTNSGLESLVLVSNPAFISVRVAGTAFDNDGLLWSLTSLIDKPLKTYNPNTGQWQSYSFSELIPDPIFDENGFRELVIDNQGTKWIASFKNGVIAFNENNSPQLKNVDEQDLDLGTYRVNALALDNNNRLWIGDTRGLRVLFNTSDFFNEDNTAFPEPIIALEDGQAVELLDEQFVSDIKVDGSNNKWIATIGAGLFYFSPNGQETIYHFTTDNSPLPSNNINDLTIDFENGSIFIGTDRGLLEFNSGSSLPQTELNDAFVYPNPVRPTFNMDGNRIKIKGISQNVNIKILDIEGNLVAEAESNTNRRFNGYNLEIDGGIAYWNGRNLANNTIASGVYLIMLSDLDSSETKVLKLMVIR